MRKRDGFFAYWPSQIKVFLMLLILVASGILLARGDFGESSPNLGQFTDDFTSLDNVSVIVNLVNNATRGVIELNGTALVPVIWGPYVREHDYYVGKSPQHTFSMGGNDYVEASSPNVPQGAGHVFFVIDRAWLSGLWVRWSWNSYYSGAAARTVSRLFVNDAEWDRTNDTHFVENQNFGPLLKQINQGAHVGWSGWITEDHEMTNIDAGSSDNVSLSFMNTDAWNGNNIKMRLDWIEFNTGAGGSGNIFTINFNDTMNLVMEVSGGVDDYGYVNNSETPWLSGGFTPEGYLTTENYLADINGSALVQLINTSIPAGTSMTVEFSVDNSTWVDETNSSGSVSLADGFNAVDLRELNWSAAHYLRYNMSGTSQATPGLYQSRLISTLGQVGIGAPGVNVSRETVTYNLTEIGVTVGTLDAGNLSSTFDIDGNMYNVSELAGAPGMQISGNFTGIDPDAGCIWVVIYAHYDGNQAHDFDIELWNFSSSAWVEDSHITDGTELTWFNSTLYGLRVPNEFLSGEEIRVRLDHESAGNINHNIFIEYFKLLAEIPAGPAPGAGAVTVVESDAPWIAIAIILMLVAYLLLRSR